MRSYPRMRNSMMEIPVASQDGDYGSITMIKVLNSGLTTLDMEKLNRDILDWAQETYVTSETTTTEKS